jgi:hypothetical protein
MISNALKVLLPGVQESGLLHDAAVVCHCLLDTGRHAGSLRHVGSLCSVQHAIQVFIHHMWQNASA